MLELANELRKKKIGNVLPHPLQYVTVHATSDWDF